MQFDELIDLLGLSNRVRKSAILQEAVAAIKVRTEDFAPFLWWTHRSLSHSLSFRRR